MKKYNFRETYLNESFFDDIEDDIDNNNVTKDIDNILFNNRLTIISTLDKLQLVPNQSNKYVYDVIPNEKTELNISKLLKNCTKLSNFISSECNIQYLQFKNCDFSNIIDMSKTFYNGYVTTIEFVGESVNTSNVRYMNSMFKNCEKLTSLNLGSFDTNNVTAMNSMFCACESLTSLDLSSFDTSNVTNMYNMFYYCKSLKLLDISSFNTSNVTNMSSMFEDCKSLESLNLSSFDTSNVRSMDSMFEDCIELKLLDLSSFDTSNVTDMSYMFENCRLLTTLDLSTFNISNVTDMSYMFSDCRNLTTLDLSNFKIFDIELNKISKMFNNCTSLNYIKCPKIFRNLCWKYKDIINLPKQMYKNGSCIWDLVD